MIHKSNWVLIVLIIISACSRPVPKEQNTKAASEPSDWKSEVEKNLQLFGHRNWIVVADAAYPLQSNQAIKTIKVDADQLETIAFVNQMIKKYEHVDATIFVDKEMAFVTENAAKGIENYRTELDKLLGRNDTNALLHEDIIRKLDESAKLFTVLILKTDLTIPYTSVFYQLECGYWDAESEESLRNDMSTE